MKRTKPFFPISCLMLMGFLVAVLPVPTQAVDWRYYDSTNQEIYTPTDDEIEKLAAKRISGTETHFALRIGHDFTKGLQSGYFENIANPNPSVGLTWIKQGDPVTCTVNGAVSDIYNLGIRYVITGYKGNAPINAQFPALALQFDGSNDYVDAPNVSLSQDSFIIEFQAKRNRLNVEEIIFSQGSADAGQGIEIGFAADNRFMVRVYGYDPVYSVVSPDMEWHKYKIIYSKVLRSYYTTSGYGFQAQIYVDDNLDKDQSIEPNCETATNSVPNYVDGCYSIVECEYYPGVSNTDTDTSSDGQYERAMTDWNYARTHWGSAWYNGWDRTDIPIKLCGDGHYRRGEWEHCDTQGENRGIIYCKGGFVTGESICKSKWYRSDAGERAWSDIWNEIKRTVQEGTTNQTTYACTDRKYSSTDTTLDIGRGISGTYYNGQIKDVQVMTNGVIQAVWAFKDGGSHTTAQDTSGNNRTATLVNFNVGVAWITNATGEAFTPLNFTEGEQKITFNMTGPANLSYQWETQYAVTVNSLPSTVSACSVTSDDAQYGGNGKFWFAPGTNLHFYGRDSSCLHLQGYRDATEPGTTISAHDFFKSINEPFGITWVYGDYIYQETVTVGSSVTLSTIPIQQRDVIGTLKPTYVSKTVPENDMCVWSDFEKKMYPLRGGESFDLEFPLDDPNCPEKKINLRVITRWPPTPHYVHVAETPPVNLDPFPDDNVAFLGMKYTDENCNASVTGTDFTAPARGRSVLLFTRTYYFESLPKDVSLQFNGSGYAEVAQPYEMNKSKIFTVSFWMKPNPGALQTIIGNEGYSLFYRSVTLQSGYTINIPYNKTTCGYRVWQSYDGKINLTLYQSETDIYTLTSDNPIPLNEWTHVAVSYSQVSYSQGQMNLFINGILAGTKEIAGYSINNPYSRFRIGRNNAFAYGGYGYYSRDPDGEYYRGQLDDVRVWNVARTQEQIQADMGIRLTGSETGLVGYWRMDTPGVDSLQDSSSSRLDAKLYGIDPVDAYIKTSETIIFSDVPAKGDLSSEYVHVRVVETRNRDEDKFPDIATAGAELFSSYHDPNSPNDGYVFYEIGPYNAEIYDRTKAMGPIYPVNIHHPNPEGTDTLLVVWYRMQDSISWPYQPIEYTISWPNYPEQNRVVIASRLGTEGKNALGDMQTYPDRNHTDDEDFVNRQNYFDPVRYTDIKLYHQPDPIKPGYNPNEEHVVVAPSFRHAAASPRPFAGYALRNDLNITTAGDTYTSDPFILVQYYDKILKRAGMKIYKVEKEDPALGYTFQYDMKAGEPVEAPYPVNTVIGATPPNEIFGKNGNPDWTCYWEDHKGQPWAISGAGKSVNIDSVAYADGSYQVTLKSDDGLIDAHHYMIQVTDATGVVGSMKFQVGVTPSVVNTTVYVDGAATLANQFNVTLNPNIEGLQKDNFSLIHYDSDAYVLSYFWYPLDPMFWIDAATPGNGTGEVGKPMSWLPSGTVAAEDGFPTDMTGKEKAVEVRYDVSWPLDVPILKAGETLTFPGGEYRADHNTDGLPGVLAWATGQVVFDELNPKMDSEKIFTDYLARLVPVLEERTVSLPLANFPETLQPASGRTEVFMGRWYFKFLHAGLKTRIFYDPLTEKLGIRGFVNDKTLGDKTLTASPPAIYVMQPNILTATEKTDIESLEGTNSAFIAAADSLYQLSRNPSAFLGKNYTVGLDTFVNLKASGETIPGVIPTAWKGWLTFLEKLYALQTEQEKLENAFPKVCMGPGLALVPNGAFLDPNSTISEGYITLAENNHPDMGALPVALHIIKVKKDKYRGAIKTILSENVFDEKITLRHTADFGANPDDLMFQWWYREEDGTDQPTPDVSPAKWKPFPDISGNNGLGMTEIGMAGAGAALLTDNLFYARYRHKDSDPLLPKSWSNWAGAANSRPGDYQAQLCEGWVKRVMFAVNPFEARIKNFYNIDNPATYISMIQQAGVRYEGAVAFNPAKDVIENVGLIELYQTVLNRSSDLSINLSQPASTSGIVTALLLAASRVADFYVLLGNEAYIDAMDPTIGIGSDSTEYGSLSPTIFTFMNQEPGLLDEELSLLRGKSELGARPTYNRLLWNFTNGQGEVAYALSYNIKDMNKDGFIDEEDGRSLYPQGHGDAWGHYLTALKGYYNLLTHPYFNWESRAEKVSIQGVVIDVDYLDERKFAEAAASKAKVGKDLINLTYRSKYTENPEGQWQGYKDTDTRRAWGVTEWGRKAFTGAYCDWLVGNAILPAEDTDENHNPIQKVDRTTVAELMEIASQAREIHQEYDNVNTGLNPIGLVTDAVPFDISTSRWMPGQYDTATHFEQIYERAEDAMKNARVIFNHANDLKNRIRKTAVTAQEFATQVENQDRDYRNRLIEIFGTPYEGTIGAGKTYPAGYKGPDYFYYNYVDVNNISDETIPPTTDVFLSYFKPVARGFAPLEQGLFGMTGTFIDQIIDVVYQDFNDIPTITDFKTAYSQFFLTDLTPAGFISTDFGQSLQVEFPYSANRYSFQAPADWGIRRAPGEIQNALTELIKSEADLRLAMADYDGVIVNIQMKLDMLVARQDLRANEVFIMQGRDRIKNALSATMLALKGVSKLAHMGSEMTKEIADDTAEALPKVSGIDNDVTAPARSSLQIAGTIAKYALKGTAIVTDIAIEQHETAVGVIDAMADFELEKFKYSYEIQNALKEIEAEMYNEAPARLEIFKRKENMRQVSDKYRTVLEKGLRLMEERKAFNARVAAKVQGNRYMDMAFRLNMNDALSKYRNMFDMAARYVYLAAKAYDYETNLADTDSASAKALLTDIVKQRTLGEYKDGQYIIGRGGLGDILGRMQANFSVLKSQMGFNNPQTESDRFSLRSELFRIKLNATEDDLWRNVLENSRVDNLWDVPEFRKFCRPFVSEKAGNQPGIVIPFSTNVIFGKNFFGWPLSGNDHAYDPTNFATKIRSVGVWFSRYRDAFLAKTPRVYLIPVGMDVMLVPNSYDLNTREWTIVDQKIPVPLPIGQSHLNNPDYIPSLDSTDGSMIEIRRYSSFRCYHDIGYWGVEEMNYDSRLIGRSVWNSRWLLIIPGGTFLADANEGLDTFIYGVPVPGATDGARDGKGINDIKLYFQTYAVSGN